MKPIGEPGWQFKEAEDSAFAFEALLKRFDIAIAPGSFLEEHVLRVLHVSAQSGSLAPANHDVRPFFQSLIGIHEIARLVLAVESHPSFASLIPHLRLLNEGNALQMTKSSGRDSATNKLFESIVACLAMTCGTDVVLDDPESSAGDNPDVLATLGGRRWGLACKVLHSTHPEGFLDHLRKGVDQIEKSPSDIGIVIFNLKNVLPHEQLWPLAPILGTNEIGPAAWPDKASAFAELVRSMDEIGRRLATHVADAPAELSAIFANKKSIEAFMLWGHTATGVLVNGRPVPTSMRCMRPVKVGAVDNAARAVLECLNWSAFSDSSSRPPKPAV